MKNIVFIGAGNMAEALVRGILRSGFCPAGHVTVTDPQPAQRELFHSKFGVRAVASNAAAIEGADVVFLAVKPQAMNDVLTELSEKLEQRSLVISIAAGVKTETLEKKMGGRVRVVRVMPNTPALVGAGASAICRGKYALDEDIQLAHQLMESVGVVVRVEEGDMDAVTALSGSGPAYVFYLMEAMLAAARQMNLDPEVAKQLVYATVEGAAKLAKESSVDVVELRRRVTSKGGTTAAALEVMERDRWLDVMVLAISAAQQRSRELSKS